MPPVACSISPTRAGGAGERAARVSEELVFEKRFGRAPRSSAPRTAVERAGCSAWIARAASSFPVPVSPVISTVPGAAAARRISSLIFCIGGALADQRLERSVGRNLPLQQIDLPRELAALGRRAHAHQELVTEERLLHEVHGAELHRFDRRVDGAEPGHDDECGIDVDVPELAEHVDARICPASACPTGSRRTVALARAVRTPASPVSAVAHGVARLREHPAHAFAHARVIVDYQNSRHVLLSDRRGQFRTSRPDRPSARGYG